jgi:hypothetical protein
MAERANNDHYQDHAQQEVSLVTGMRCVRWMLRGEQDGGRETDLLAVFETQRAVVETEADKLLERDRRFAIHVEVKHPGDKFKDEEYEYQAATV